MFTTVNSAEDSKRNKTERMTEEEVEIQNKGIGYDCTLVTL